MTKPMTKDKIIDSVIEEFDIKFPEDFLTTYQFDEDLKDDFKSFLRTKLEGIVLSEGEVAELLENKKFIKDEESPNYPQNKVLLVKGLTAKGIEIGLSNYCAVEYAKAITAKQGKGVNDE
jgi:hypothetical protein